MTRQRMIILEELRKVNTHPSADEVYEMVRKRLPRISSKTGEIQKLEPGSTLKRFDGNPAEHYHIHCIQCDRVVDAHIHNELNFDNVLKQTGDFEIIGHKLEFIGLCPACAEDSSPA
jgi:Fur family ferric uptake transcriptional regulator